MAQKLKPTKMRRVPILAFFATVGLLTLIVFEFSDDQKRTEIARFA